ncbi:MAG: hypothetical protein AMXMBFR64_02790 [Myxococcales bacterium]
MRTLRIITVGLAALATVTGIGCETEEASSPSKLLSLSVFSPTDPLFNPWTNTASPIGDVRVSISGSQLAAQSKCTAYGPGSVLEIPAAPFDLDFQVIVELYAPSTEPCTGALLGRGCSKRLKVSSQAPTPLTGAVMVTRVNRFSPTASQLTGGQATSLNEPRYGASTTLLPDGRVLIVGGARMKPDKAKIVEQSGDPNPWDNPANIAEVLTSVELYDPESGAFDPLIGTQLFYPRAFHHAIYLPGLNKVAIVGGITLINNQVQGSNHAELYDPDTRQVLDAATVMPLLVERWGSSATLLNYGKTDVFVLLAGGRAEQASGSFEVWNPAQGSIAFGPSAKAPDSGLVAPRWNHVATAVEKDNYIFFIGGEDGSKTVATIDVFDKVAGAMLPNGKIPEPLVGDLSAVEKGRVGHQAVYVSKGGVNAVYVLGGYQDRARSKLVNRIEVINTQNGQALAGPQDGFNLCTARAMHQATLMDDGRILVAGGLGASNKVVGAAEVIGSVTVPGGAPEIRSVRADAMIHQRFMHNVVYLPNHYALAVGGLNSIDLNLELVQPTELFNYDPSPIPSTAGCAL